MGISSWIKAGALVVMGVSLCGCQNDGRKNNSVVGPPPSGKLQTSQVPPPIPPSFPTTGSGGMNAGGATFNPNAPLGGGSRNLGPAPASPTSFNATPSNGLNSPTTPTLPTSGLGGTPTLPGNNTGIVPGASGVRNNEYYVPGSGGVPAGIQPPVNQFAPGGLAPLGGSVPPPAPPTYPNNFQVPRN